VALTRWTIRGVEQAVIEQVRAAHRRTGFRLGKTGFRLGKIVSAAIRLGLPAALAELRDHAPGRPSIRKGFFEMVGELSRGSSR
jgi:hypothetical protein